MKLLTKANFAIARLADAKAENATHRSIFVSPDETRVTDGHCAFIITTVEPEQLPLFDDSEQVELAEYYTGFALDRDSAIHVFKSIPKPKKNEPNDKSRFAVVDATSENNQRAVISVTDLRRQAVLKADKMPCDYPDIRRAFPKGKPKLAIKFNPDLLSNALKAVAEFAALTNCHSIELSFFGPDKAAMISAKGFDQELTGAVMPQHFDGDDQVGGTE